VRVLQAQGRETGSLSQLAGAALALADRLDLSTTQREALELGALLHDIGEIRVPDAVLEKAGPLTPEERGLVSSRQYRCSPRPLMWLVGITSDTTAVGTRKACAGKKSLSRPGSLR
jgi:hypothetical protein